MNWVDPWGLAGFHFDSSGKYIHQGKYRFDSKGNLVDHLGRKLKTPEKGGNWRDAKNTLKFLKGKKPDFFRIGPLMLIFPGQEKMIDNFNKGLPFDYHSFDSCGRPST